MLQPTGSVYLDAPRPVRDRTPPRPDHSLRSMLSGLLACFGLLSLTVGLFLGGARALVSDPGTITTALDSALADPTVRAELEQEIAQTVVDDLVGPDLGVAAAQVGLDVELTAQRLAPAVLDDATFRAELTTLIEATHEQVLFDPTGQPLNLTPITNAILAIVEREAPELSRFIPSTGVAFAIDTAALPDLTGPMALMDRLILTVAAGGFSLPLAWMVHTHRHRVIAWCGRWLLTMGLIAALAAVGLPYLGGKLSGYNAVEVTVRAMSTRLLGPAALAGLIGMALISVASVLRSRERHRAAEEGAAAALGVNEPELFRPSRGPELDLAQRGLVDANHPLTNI